MSLASLLEAVEYVCKTVPYDLAFAMIVDQMKYTQTGARGDSRIIA